MGKERQPKWLRELLRGRDDWTAQRTRGDHVRLEHRSGAVLFTGMTPSDRRGARNLSAHMRRVERQARSV